MKNSVASILLACGFESNSSNTYFKGIGSLVWGRTIQVKIGFNGSNTEYTATYHVYEYNCDGDPIIDKIEKATTSSIQYILDFIFERFAKI